VIGIFWPRSFGKAVLELGDYKMLKALLAASILTSMILPLASHAQAEHRFRRFNPFYAFDYDNDYQDEALIDESDEDEIIIPRRRDRRDWVYDPDTDEFIYRPRLKKPLAKKKVVTVQRPKKPLANTRPSLTEVEKRRIAAITGKPQKIQAPTSKKIQAASLPKGEAVPVAKPAAPKIAVGKPEAAKPEIAKPVVQMPAPAITALAPVTPSKSARLVLPAEPAPKPVVTAPKVAAPQVAVPRNQSPKTQRLAPISPPQSAISCDKAAGIVTGFGFTGVSPQFCVGKTYTFKAMRDGKQFEVRVSSANGELTEVRKL
jgi:hypothetical protein